MSKFLGDYSKFFGCPNFLRILQYIASFLGVWIFLIFKVFEVWWPFLLQSTAHPSCAKLPDQPSYLIFFQFSDVCIATTQAVPPGQCLVPKLQGKPKATSLHLRWGRYTEEGFGHLMSLLMTKPNKIACAPSKDSFQPGHPPSLIIVFAVRMKKAWVLSYPLSAQRRLWSDWADAQADLSLRWAHMPFCWFYREAALIIAWWRLKRLRSEIW